MQGFQLIPMIVDTNQWRRFCLHSQAGIASLSTIEEVTEDNFYPKKVSGTTAYVFVCEWACVLVCVWMCV